MSDLLKRLRARHDATWLMQITDGDLINDDGPAAADEIERLREALKAAERAIDDCQSYRSHIHHQELAQVRAALNGEDA